MSLTSFLASADLALDSNEQECEPLPSAKLTHSVGESSQSTGPMSPSMTMLEPLPPNDLGQMGLLQTLSPAGSHAKIFQWREIAPGLRARGLAYGRNTPDLLARYDRDSRLWKTSQVCFLLGLETFSETWPRSGMMRSGIAYQLSPLVLLMDETECGLLPTPRTSKQKRAWKAYRRQDYHGNLEEFLGECGFSWWITPQFVSWMMGFPLMWTSMKPSATPSSPKSPKS
jgi:hypothetical protein